MFREVQQHASQRMKCTDLRVKLVSNRRVEYLKCHTSGRWVPWVVTREEKRRAGESGSLTADTGKNWLFRKCTEYRCTGRHPSFYVCLFVRGSATSLI